MTVPNRVAILNDDFPNRRDDDIQNRHDSVVVTHQQWSGLGIRQILVNNVGHDGAGTRYPIGVMTDPLEMKFNGGQLATDSGLMPTHDEQGEILPAYKCLLMMMDRFLERDMLLLIPRDAHADYDHDLIADALTEVRLTPDFVAQMNVDDVSTAQITVPDKMRDPYSPLTGSEWTRIFGRAVDGEFRSPQGFFEHCAGKGVQMTPEVASRIQGKVKAAMSNMAGGVPELRVIPVSKLNLQGNVSPDQRGIGGNLYDAIIEASQYGMPQGKNYWRQRRMMLWGTAMPYSVMLEGLHGAAKGFEIHMMLSGIFTVPGEMSKAEVARFLFTYYPHIKFHYFWDKVVEEMLGPAPVGYNDTAMQVLIEDREFHAAAMVRHFGFKANAGRPERAAYLAGMYKNIEQPSKGFFIPDWDKGL